MMDMFVVQGGTPLAGRVRVGGSKNATLPMMAAALAGTGPTVLSGAPDLVDVRTMTQLLESLGVRCDRSGDQLILESFDERPHLAHYELVRRMRASVCVLGPLVGRRRRGIVSLPGGCNIGHRPIDLHLQGLSALGAQVEVRSGYVHASTAGRLRGAVVEMSGPQGTTVTGTFNVMAAAALARGTTVIRGAATEPEIVAAGEMLNQMGARIQGLGTSQLIIDGVEELQGVTCSIIPDRIEAGTLMIAAAVTGGRVELENVVPEHLTAVTALLGEIGVQVFRVESESAAPRSRLAVVAGSPLRAVQFSATPYPGIPTDLQAQFMALLSLVPGTSRICDRVFPDRFMHVSELCRLGAQIRLGAGTAEIQGVPRLSGANVMASDLRASAALVLAGLAADGDTTIRRIYHLDRGYERLEEKLRLLGAGVSRVHDSESLHRWPFTAAEAERRSA